MPEHPLTLDLAQITGDDLGKVGGKAANLGELIRKGFPVPEGFVITTTVYTRFLNDNALEDEIRESLETVDFDDPDSIEWCSKTIRKAIKRSTFPPELVKEIETEYSRLQQQPVAVRSSATSEDQPTASFAGQLETFLNVHSLDEVIHHVKGCYASLWTGRAIAYRNRNRIPHASVKMAVIIQAMVPAKSAGVLFTVNPVSSDRSELLIESNFGFGVSVVSGRAIPDKFTVSRSDQPGGEPFKIISREIGTKNLVAQTPSTSSKGGVEYIEFSWEQSHQPSLSDEQILGLARVGRQIEISLGYPQDIEWAVDGDDNILILQSRPITVLTSPASHDEIVWTRGYSDDYWNDPVSPLFFELLGNQLTEIVNVELNQIMGYFHPGSHKTDQLLKLHHGHVYFNLEVLKRKVEYEIPTFLRNDDILNYFPEGGGSYGKETMKKLPFRLGKRLIAEIRVMLFDPDGSVNKTASAYEAWSRDVFSPFWDGFDSRMAELLEDGTISAYIDLADELDRVMAAHFRLVRYGIPVHNIGMNLLTQYLLTRFLGREAALQAYPVLISGLKHMTSETNARINHLTAVVRSSPELRRLILDEPSEELYGILSSIETSEVRSFVREFDSFIEAFGVRGFTREPYYPRWYEAPQYVFDILKALVRDQRQDLEAIEARNLRSRREIEEKVEREICSQRLGKLKWKLFSTILGFARRYIIFREDQRFNLDRWITMNRRIYLEIGRILQHRGILQDASKIFFLKRGEIRKLATDAYTEEKISRILRLVEERKAEFLKYEHTTPPKFLQGPQEFNDPPPVEGTSFQGIPASQGILTAPVRVLNNIQDIWQVRAGDILVVPRTDPGWTPVFCKIGGLITETGGVLSHGAVVSREYGIPAVTNIHNACQVFQTGQIVTIDGVKGVVNIEKQR